MCGITGFYAFKGSLPEVDFKKFNDLLIHRGPDSQGVFSDDSIFLGHTRLSILDLSASGNQPMTSHNGRFVMVYNGEIYNYRDIANEIKTHTSQEDTILFNSSSDTEVILEAFVLWGPEFVHRLNGMFSIAIYDTIDKELFLFRDRLGIKPLYYCLHEDTIVFSSELKAIQSLDFIPKTLNKAAIFNFLNLGYIPAPHSIYNEIKKLQSGCYLKINSAGSESIKYWNLYSQLTDEVIHEEKKALILLSDLLVSSVQYQLKSDVPVGIFLSGGIDSSLIAAQAAGLSSTQINTFSIGFENNKSNETPYARKVAQQLKTCHSDLIVSEKEAFGYFEELTSVYDEPFSDSSAIPAMIISKLAKGSVTVTLSGEGGDELFFGYGSYKWAERLDNSIVRNIGKSLYPVLNKTSNNRLKRAVNLFNYSSNARIMRHIFSQEQYNFSDKEITSLLEKNYKNISWDLNENPYIKLNKRKLQASEKQALFDLEYYLQDDLLTKVDRASMKYSVETRVPFLDHRVVEFALNISPELKIKNGVSKYLLKEILYQYLPKELFNRPKQGFSIPLGKWLKGGLFSNLIEMYLSEETVKHFGIVNHLKVKELIFRFKNGEDYLYQRIWLLITLHKWLKQNHN
ncbi:MAG: asparagine synthase (glutamine-hydrolyzing) [Bacteroidetes bacterium]|nr:asparagine synthase (glutamine-hydrolyzing) [Bacteroidota bacterium]HET6244017.1 asparagine synthase (glutamine-hydrolyzing) [Bacteroidia bacterium]